MMKNRPLRYLATHLGTAILAVLMILFLIQPARQVFALVLPVVAASCSSKTDYTMTIAGQIFANSSTYTPTDNRGIDYRVKGTSGWNNIPVKTTDNPFFVTRTNLIPDTTYEVRTWTDTSLTRAYSTTIEVTTDKVKSGPTLNTPTIHNLTASSATVQCRIVDDGNAPPIILRRIWVKNFAQQDTVNAIGLFSFTFSDLVPNTSYEAIAEVRNSFGTTISAVAPFTTPNGYMITYNLNGGILPVGYAKYYTQGVTFTLPTPTRSGHAFGGWYNNINFFGSAVTTIPSTATGDKTYYAKWIPIYSITYNLNGGVNPAGAPTTYRSDVITILPTPTRSGYTFGGWYDNAQLSGAAVSSIGLGSSGDKSFWAKWALSSTPTPTAKPATPTLSPTISPTVSPKPLNTPAPTGTPAPTTKPVTPTLSPTISPTVSPKPLNTPAPTSTPAMTVSPASTPAGTVTPSTGVTAGVTNSPTAIPTPSVAITASPATSRAPTTTPAGANVASPSPEPTTAGSVIGIVTAAPTQLAGSNPEEPGDTAQTSRWPIWLIVLISALVVVVTGFAFASVQHKRRKRQF